RERFGQLDAAKTREDFVAAAQWARAIPGGNGRLGAVGFCWGGGTVNTIATRVPELVKAAGVRYETVKYPGTQHGFNNDTTPRFDEQAARQAWGRTIALFNGTLRR